MSRNRLVVGENSRQEDVKKSILEFAVNSAFKKSL